MDKKFIQYLRRRITWIRDFIIINRLFLLWLNIFWLFYFKFEWVIVILVFIVLIIVFIFNILKEYKKLLEFKNLSINEQKLKELLEIKYSYLKFAKTNELFKDTIKSLIKATNFFKKFNHKAIDKNSFFCDFWYITVQGKDIMTYIKSTDRTTVRESFYIYKILIKNPKRSISHKIYVWPDRSESFYGQIMNIGEKIFLPLFKIWLLVWLFMFIIYRTNWTNSLIDIMYFSFINSIDSYQTVIGIILWMLFGIFIFMFYQLFNNVLLMIYPTRIKMNDELFERFFDIESENESYVRSIIDRSVMRCLLRLREVGVTHITFNKDLIYFKRDTNLISMFDLFGKDICDNLKIRADQIIDQIEFISSLDKIITKELINKVYF